MASGEKNYFKKQWAELHMREILSDRSTAASDADTFRTILTHVDYAKAKDILDNASTQAVTRQYYQKYADLADAPEEDGGLNNYADSILTKIEGLKNESQEWKCSLTLDKVAGWKCVQNLQETSQAAMNSLIPEGKENVPLKLNSEPKRKPSTNQPFKERQSEQSAPGISICYEQTSSNRLDGKDNRVTNSNQNPRLDNLIKGQQKVRQSGHSEKTHVFKEQEGLFKQNLNANSRKNALSATSNHEPFSSFNTAPMEPIRLPDSNNTATSFWNMGQSSNDMPGAVKKPSNDSSHGNFFQPQNVFSRNAIEDEEPRQNNTTSFKTAREQLAIDNQKKFGRSRNDPQTSLNPATYGTSKKSLGTRRGLNSKFVPPVMNRDSGDDDGGALVRKVGSNKASSGDQSDEPVDERLKNIEQKMVELIMSEIMDHGPPISWDDIAGLKFAKKTIKEIVVWPMLRPDIFTGLRGPPKGLLLFGPPGTGKTLIGKCIASQSKSTFFSISASSLTSKWVGEGEKMVRALFAVARVHQPAVVFMDEIDSLLSQRSDNEHESSRRIKTEFLVQLDGATSGDADRILIVGATNRPQEIDEAARRRFVKRLYIPLPEAIARSKIVENLMSQQKHHLEEHQLQQIVEKSLGYSGSDMANLCREAALGPIRSMPFEEIEHITADQVRPILHEDFEAAFTQVRASVSERDLELYVTWNKQYGSWDLK